jgi:hypothetical protein
MCKRNFKKVPSIGGKCVLVYGIVRSEMSEWFLRMTLNLGPDQLPLFYFNSVCQLKLLYLNLLTTTINVHNCSFSLKFPHKRIRIVPSLSLQADKSFDIVPCYLLLILSASVQLSSLVALLIAYLNLLILCTVHTTLHSLQPVYRSKSFIYLDCFLFSA